AFHSRPEHGIPVSLSRHSRTGSGAIIRGETRPSAAFMDKAGRRKDRARIARSLKPYARRDGADDRRFAGDRYAIAGRSEKERVDPVGRFHADYSRPSGAGTDGRVNID